MPVEIAGSELEALRREIHDDPLLRSAVGSMLPDGLESVDPSVADGEGHADRLGGHEASYE